MSLHVNKTERWFLAIIRKLKKVDGSKKMSASTLYTLALLLCDIKLINFSLFILLKFLTCLCRYLQSVESPHRRVRTRLYFTSESHVHTVLNVLRHGKLFEVSQNLC